jgi:hypothetical protein
VTEFNPSSSSRIDLAQTTLQLDDVFTRLERARRQALRSFLLAIAAALGCLVLAVAPVPLFFEFESDVPGAMSGRLVSVMNQPAAEVADIAVTAAFFWFLACIVTGSKIFRHFGQLRRWRYHQRYKSKVLTALCDTHFPGISYEAGKGMPWKLLDESDLFPFISDAYNSEDCFSGRWGSTDVAFAEATAAREQRKLTSNGVETVSEIYFNGLIFVADFHKHFHGTTRLIPRGEEGGSRRSLQPAVFEDPRFEALFETWTTDQTEVRYLLSSSMLERFCNLYRRFPKLRARFKNEQLLLLLPGSYDRFEPSLFRPADNSSQLQQMADDLHACLEIVDELNLNTRIWSKV